MCAAGALRGSPASMTMTERRWRPSWSAAASPAAEPPMTATSQCRSTVRGVRGSLMDSTIRSLRRVLQDALAVFARRRERQPMAEPNEIEQVVRTRLRSLRQHAGPVARRARRPHQPQPVHHQPDRDRQADDQPRRPAAAGRGPPGRPRRAPRRAQRRRRGHPPGAEQLGRAHDLDAEPADRQHDRDQDAARTDRPARRSSGSIPVTTGSSSSRGGCGCSLGEREIIVETGEAAEFATMTPARRSPPSTAPPSSS